MWFSVSRSFLGFNVGATAGGLRSSSVISNTIVRYFSRKRAENLRKINPKVTPQEASVIAHDLYGLIKQNGPLTVSNTWVHAKENDIGGLKSKTHLKILLKWMRGRKMLKLFCNQVGSNKKFLLSTLPEEPKTDQLDSTPEPKLQREKKPLAKGRKQSK